MKSLIFLTVFRHIITHILNYRGSPGQILGPVMICWLSRRFKIVLIGIKSLLGRQFGNFKSGLRWDWRMSAGSLIDYCSKLKLDQSVDQQSFYPIWSFLSFYQAPSARCMWRLVFLISQTSVLSFSITGNTCHKIMDYDECPNLS